MAKYKFTLGASVIRTEDSASIPFDGMNADYQAYQAWCNAGGIPDPADPEPAPVEAPKPSVADLQAQLAALTAQITALATEQK